MRCVRYFRYYIVTLLIANILWSHNSYAADYHFVAISDSMLQKVAQKVLPLLYNKLGLSIHISPLAAKRAQLESSSGLKDGEVLRVHSYGEVFQNTIRVPTPYYELTTTAFVRKGSGIQIDTPEDLKNYRIVKVSGVRHTSDITAGMENVVDVRTPEEMMRYLSNHRADIALSSLLGGTYVLKKFAINNIEPIPKPLAVLSLYHYLYKDHHALAVMIDNVIREETQSGNLARWLQQAEQEVIAGQ